VYLHFASKEELVVALFERDMQNLLQVVAEQVDSTASAHDKMEAILQVMYGELFSKRIQLLYSIYQSPELRKNFEEKGCMRALWEELVAHITSLLEEGKAAGEFDVTLLTPVMVSAFFSLLSPKNYERLTIEGQLSPGELAQQLGRIYFKGIAAN
jgi:AcrR family transcriptional regulator